MTQQPATSTSHKASAEMADRTTPFIRNAWYVIAESNEVGRQLMSRSALGSSIVLYRVEAGGVVALHNRCCHRSFPLSQGRLEGDTIVCGYHGLRYDASGRCIEIPMQTVVPAAVRVRRFATLERDPFIWIWMGAEAEADTSLLPDQYWMHDPEWDSRRGYLYIKGNYVRLHENLLDLSHLSFLHANTFGTPEYARAPVEMRINGDDLQVWRHVECILPAIYAKPLGWEGARTRRSSGSQFVSPGLHVNTGIFRNLEQPCADGEVLPSVKVAQLITPETADSTHYWTLQARNFARGDDTMGRFMIEQQMAAFREDVLALEQIAQLEELEGGAAVREVSLPTDHAGVLMRRLLKRLAGREAIQ